MCFGDKIAVVYVMYDNYEGELLGIGGNMSDLDVITKIERLLGVELKQLEKIQWNSIGYILNESMNVVALSLYNSLGKNCIKKLVSLLREFTNLVHLDLNENKIEDISPLSELTQLKELNLGSFMWTGEKNQIKDITPLQSLTNLTHLQMGCNQLTDISVLKNMTKLTYLELSANYIKDVSPLKELKELSQLHLAMNYIRDISSLKKLTELRKLMIRRNLLTDITILGSFTKLSELHLDGNKIADISFLKYLKNLKYLQLGNNNLNDISVLKNLTNLTQLNLSENQLREISALKELTNLIQLDLSKNQLWDISVLKYLTNLTELSLYNNQISDITVLKNLTQLRKLYLGKNKITDVTEISNLFNLTELNLYSNQLRNISALRDVNQLTHLDLSRNQITNVSALKGLTNLSQLNLRGNQLSDISSLKHLTNLTQLDLGVNHITDLSTLNTLTNLTQLIALNNKLDNISVIKGLINLIHLDLSENNLKDLTTLKYFTKLQEFRIVRNPVENPPPEILKQGIKTIQYYLNSLDEAEERLPINEVKVLLIGNGGAGKTSLIKRVLHNEFDEDESQTNGINIDAGIEVDDWDFIAKKTSIKAHFWDFGGQEIMHHTHQFFLSKRSLYVLVLDGRKDEKPEYWLKLIESFGGDSPVLIVLNKIDVNPGHEINRKFLQEKYNGIRGFHRISCARSTGISDFRKILKNELAVIEHVKTDWVKSWFEVKQELETSNEDYISCDKFEEICIEHKITDESSQETLVNFLNDLGIVLHFDDSALQETNVINPTWLTEAAYKILNSEKLANKKGILNINTLSELLDAKIYPKKKHHFIIEIMKKFELCYSVDNQTILVPNLTKVDEPEFEFDYDSALKFIFDYEEFLPLSIIPRFIVKMHEDIPDDKLCWRTGVVLANEAYHSTAVIKADYSANKISVWVKGSQQRDYFSVIRYKLRSINKSFEKLSFIELVPLPDTNRPVEYEVLIGLEEMGDEDYTDGKLRLKYNVKKLLSGIETEFNRTIMQTLNEIRDTQIQMFERQEDESVLQELMLSKQTDVSKLLKEFMQVKPIEETFIQGLSDAMKIEPNFFGIGVDLKKFFSVMYKIIFK